MWGVRGFGFRGSGFGFRISGFGFRVSGFGFRVSGFGSRVSGLGSRVSGLGVRVEWVRVERFMRSLRALGFIVSGCGIECVDFVVWGLEFGFWGGGVWG